MQLRRSWWALPLAALVLAACGSPASTSTSGITSAAPTAAPAAAPTTAPAASKPVIKLAENSWTGSSINVNVAKLILEQQLGYKVEIVTIDENAQWPALANGDLSASLEVWPSGHGDSVKQYITEKKVVDNLGELGVIGKISWYVPTYMVEQNPELGTAEGLEKPENAALFKTAETGSKGQFLAGDPAWVQYDESIIKNLNMNLQVVRAGSEQAVLAALDAAYNRKQPLLFYFWTPHAIHTKYKLTPVKLPAYSEACYAKKDADGVACDYPQDVLFKIASAKLKDQAPDAYAMLARMKYSTDDQIAMIASVEIDKKTAEEAAKDWVAKNEAVWKTWLSK